MSVLWDKAKEVLIAVLPITGVVLLIQLFFGLFGIPLPGVMIGRFLLGALLVIVGLSVFLLGVEIGITPLGTNIGAMLSKQNKLWLLAVSGFVVGFFICIAEPDLQILAGEVSAVTAGQIGKMLMLVTVSLGIALMLVAGHIRIVYNFPIRILLVILYAIVLILALLTRDKPEFLAISFDASGATTGALTVPFILALALGVSGMKKDSKASEEDSFGLIGISSVGAVIGVLVLGFFIKTEHMTGVLSSKASASVLDMISNITKDSFKAIIPIIIIFLVLEFVVFRISKRMKRRIFVGLIYTCLGLILFLFGVNIGFMELGVEIGRTIISSGGPAWSVVVGFVLGLVTILAEPAVYVLTHQIEDVTAGYVPRKVVLCALSIGVGAAVGLSVLRITVPGIQLWHFLLPGFVLAVVLSFITPKLFVGIGFDSGGVASGPMTATFVLAFSQGVADAIAGADVFKDAFGMIAMVAMTPILALQILGLIFKNKSKAAQPASLSEGGHNEEI
ncbi:MAG: DUF1538 domain-containing protein [Peptococcaceae bacterium]|nr:DUF1538 domain-containing protein [Peptococcaceae bacterium]